LGPELCAGKSAVGGVILVPELKVMVGITVVNHFILVNVIQCGLVISITFVGAQGGNLIGDGVKQCGVLFSGFIFEVLEESVGEGGLRVHGFNGLVQCLVEVMEHGLVAFFDPDFKVVHGSVELVLERDLHLMGFRAQ
jgi:hypothetical protein